MAENAELTEQEKKLATLVQEKLDEVKSEVDENSTEKFRVLKEDTLKEIKDNFKSQFDEIKGQIKSTKDELLDEVDKASNKGNVVNQSINLGLKTLLNSVTATDEFKTALFNSKNTSGKDLILDLHDLGSQFKDSGTLKGLNVYGEASDNGLTDTNIFEATTSEEALDSLFLFINSDDVDMIKLRAPFVFPYLSVIPTNKPVFAYSEVVPKTPVGNDLGFQVVKEGGLKPLQDMAISSSKTKPIKLAKGMVYTMETEEDIPNWNFMIRDLLSQEHSLAQQEAILKYVDPTDPLSDNNGFFNNCVPFDPSTVQSSVQDPNLVDVIKACVAQVRTSYKYNFGAVGNPNAVFLNPLTYEYQISMLKDGENRPLVETDFRQRMKSEYGIDIVTDLSIPEGQIFCGDFKKFYVRPYKPFSIRLAWINDMAIHNQLLTIAESRHIQYLKSFDQIFIICDEIDLIKTALGAGPIV